MKLVGFNKTEIAERFYKAQGNFTNRDQAMKNFSLKKLRYEDKKLIESIMDEIVEEGKKELWGEENK